MQPSGLYVSAGMDATSAAAYERGVFAGLGNGTWSGCGERHGILPRLSWPARSCRARRRRGGTACRCHARSYQQTGLCKQNDVLAGDLRMCRLLPWYLQPIFGTPSWQPG